MNLDIKNITMKTLLLFVFFFTSCISLTAQQFVYKPINPAFGGDTFNYQWLLSSANAQNQFDDNDDKYGNLLGEINSLDSFTKSLNRQMLSQLTNQLFSEQFGDGAIKPGKYMMGSLYLDVLESSQGLVINILDTTTGEQSQIIIPR